MQQSKQGRFLFVLSFGMILVSCTTTKFSPKRAAAAKTSFDRISKELHLPSAEATGARRNELLAEAASGYERLLRDYSDQPFWCAQAVRSLGNIRVVQGKLDEAIKFYTRVGKRYPGEEWEVLQSWKTAADLLWDGNRQTEAKVFYQQIVTRFDKPEASSVTKIIVATAKKRLALPVE